MTPYDAVEPIVSTPYGVGTLAGVPWTGEASPFGVPYVFPEWYRQDIHGAMTWKFWDSNRVTWTFTARWDRGVTQHPRHGNLKMAGIPVSMGRWWLTESARGWSVWLNTPTPNGSREFSTETYDAIRVADRIIRNVENMPDVIRKGHTPRLRAGVFGPDDIGEWQCPEQPTSQETMGR